MEKGISQQACFLFLGSWQHMAGGGQKEGPVAHPASGLLTHSSRQSSNYSGPKTEMGNCSCRDSDVEVAVIIPDARPTSSEIDPTMIGFRFSSIFGVISLIAIHHKVRSTQLPEPQAILPNLDGRDGWTKSAALAGKLGLATLRAGGNCCASVAICWLVTGSATQGSN
jgi:hypothetical protein